MATKAILKISGLVCFIITFKNNIGCRIHTEQKLLDVVAQAATENDRFTEHRKANFRWDQTLVHHGHHIVFKSKQLGNKLTSQKLRTLINLTAESYDKCPAR